MRFRLDREDESSAEDEPELDPTAEDGNEAEEFWYLQPRRTRFESNLILQVNDLR